MTMEETVKQHTKDLKQLQALVNDLSLKLGNIDSTLKEILNALQGSALTGDNGIVDKVYSHDKRISRLEKFTDKFWIYMGIVTAVFGMISPLAYAFILHKLGW